MNLYYNFFLKKIGTNATCILKKGKNKINYTVSMPRKHICTVSMPHSVPRQQICTVIWGMGVFPKKKFYEDANQTENLKAKTGNGLYYRSEKHY